MLTWIVGVDGSLVREFKHSSVRIEYPLPALYMGTEYFIPAGTFKTARREYRFCPAKTFYIMPNASETAVLFRENVLGGTKKRLSIPSSPTVSLDIPRILHLLQNICGFQANSLVGYPRPRLGIVLRARLSEKSNIPQRESGIRFRPLHGQNLPIHAICIILKKVDS